MKQTKKREIKKDVIKLKLVASFGCVHFENITNITMAFVQAGRFVNVSKNGIDGYKVHIYERVY